MTDVEWPNLFVIGGLRCGSTTLWAYLNQHPDIFMSAFKEPNHFTTYVPVGRTFKDDASYLELFRGATERYRGEASAGYYADPTSAPAIKQASPDAKILLILRDPVERAYSHYWHAVAYSGETRPFAQVVQDDVDQTGHPRAYVRFGFYAEALHRFQDLFGDNVHVLFLEELQHAPQEVMRQVFQFLGVDAGYADQLTPEHHNLAAMPRARFSQALFQSANLRRVGRVLVPSEHRDKIVKLLYRKEAKPPMNPATRSLLRRVYEPDRPPLEELVGRSVPWPTDQR